MAVMDTQSATASPAGVIARLRSLLGGSSEASVTRRLAGTIFVIRVVSAVLAYFSQILLARWMGGSDYGVYVYVWTWVLLLFTGSDVCLLGGCFTHFRVDGAHFDTFDCILPAYEMLIHVAILSSLSTPRATILSASSDNGRCSALASFHGARIHTSRSSSVVRIKGIAFGWIGSTMAFGEVVRKP